jgi:hypothetical protein
MYLIAESRKAVRGKVYAAVERELSELELMPKRLEMNPPAMRGARRWSRFAVSCAVTWTLAHGSYARCDMSEAAEHGLACLAPNADALPAAPCVATEGMTVPVPADRGLRVLAWFSADGREVVLDDIAPTVTSVNLASQPYGIVTLAFSGDARRGWPSVVTVSIARDGKEAWRIAVAKGDVLRLRRVRLPAGKYSLTATTPHHATIERHQLLVAAGRETSIGALRFRPAGTITGHFVDGAGAAIVGVTVQNSDDGRVIAMADPTGALVAELPPQLPLSLDIVASGYATHHVKIDPAATEVALGTMTLSRGDTLRVRIDRAVIPRATITAALLAPDEGQRDRRTIAKRTLEPPASSLEFPALEAGDYTLLLIGASPFERYAENVRIRDHDVEREIRVEPITVQGEVLLGDAPLAGGVLSLEPANHAWEEGVTLDDHGAFSTNVWQRGRFYGFVFGGKVGSGAFVREALDASVDPTHWHIVISNRRIAGRIFDKDTGQPLHEVSMDERSWRSDGGSGMGVVTVGEDGSFSIDAADVGDYELNVHAADYLAARSRVTLRAEDTIRTVDFPMERGRVVPLVITTTAGDPIPAAVVIDGLGADGVNPDHVYVTDAAGHLDLRMKSDETTTLYVLPREGSFAIVDVRAGEKDATAAQRIVVPPAAGDLRIHVVDGDGKPLPNIQPLIRFEGRFLAPPVPRFFSFVDPRFAGIWTNEAGDADFKAFPAGVYEVYACRSEAEVIATLSGVPPREPTRVALDRGPVTVRIVMP